MPAVEDGELRRLAFAAGEGDSVALERVVAAVQDDVYRLALRMLWDPEDARDATQEALIRLMTRIGSYRGEAAFGTWAYRVAANHILNWRKSRVEQQNLDFRRFGEDLQEGLADAGPSLPDAGLLAEEVKLGCTLGMLLCLDRPDRLAYVLSDVFDLPSEDGGFICDTTPAAFRKRASRARARLREFVSAHCGLVNRAAACRCDKRVDAAVRMGRVRPGHLQFVRRDDAASAVAEMERLHDLASLMKSHPDYAAPEKVTAAVRNVLDSGAYRLLD
ncbi:MAG TPA: RNA polymerase sigma factor [Acidimicrobiales bacterium]|jgi:RNA polymerase sigma factor (sigma-70 family)|nr:RNA polymerase sigma factor [Acidimicrobiales bacterium]